MPQLNQYAEYFKLKQRDISGKHGRADADYPVRLLTATSIIGDKIENKEGTSCKDKGHHAGCPLWKD